MKKGKYKAKKDCRFIVGVSSFGLNRGAIVEVKQIDNEYKKVLVDFGSRNIDWISNYKFKCSFEPC